MKTLRNTDIKHNFVDATHDYLWKVFLESHEIVFYIIREPEVILYHPARWTHLHKRGFERCPTFHNQLIKQFYSPNVTRFDISIKKRTE